MDLTQDRDNRIKEYLNVDKDEYLNRNEYEEFSREEAVEEWAPQATGKYSGYTEEAEQLERSPEIENQQLRYKYMDSNPIEETVKESLSGTREIGRNGSHMKLDKKAISIIFPNFNDKLHLVWERERLQRKRQAKQRMNDPMQIHEYLKNNEPLFSTRTARGKVAEFDYMKRPANRKRLIESLKSSVPNLSDHYNRSVTHSSAALDTSKAFRKVYNQFKPKKGSDLATVFKQSEYQNRLNNKPALGGVKAPDSHFAFNKLGTSRTFMTPVEYRYGADQSIAKARRKMHHVSHVF